MAGVPTAMTLLHDLQTKFFNIMTSQRDNTLHIRQRATLEYVKRIDATRYIAPCMCHTIRHIHGNDVIPFKGSMIRLLSNSVLIDVLVGLFA